MSEPAISTQSVGGRPASSRNAPLRPPRASRGLYTVTPFCHNLDHAFAPESNEDRMTPYHRPVPTPMRGAPCAFLAALVLITGQAAAAAQPPAAPDASAARPVTMPAAPPKFRVGTLQAEAIRESSGIVASRKFPGVYWTHNDSGNPPVLYAVTREGELIREYPVAARNEDWEDIAIDDAGHLYIADTGNNAKGRQEMLILRVDEPNPRAPQQGRPAPLRVTTTWRLAYPDPANRFDCEALFIHAGHGHLIPKRRDGSVAEIYRFPLDPAPAAPTRTLTPESITNLPGIRAPVTAADISPDGRRLAVLTVLGPYVIELENNDLSAAGKSKTTFSRYIDPVMEAACLTPDGLLVTNESRAVFLFRDEHFKPVER
jgi:hypothetical protein